MAAAAATTVLGLCHSSGSSAGAGAGPASGRRPFLSAAAGAVFGQGPLGASAPHHTLTTARTLPYAASDLFRIIADVDAYAQFLPHCTASRVTQWRTLRAPASSSSSSSSSSWPARADLTVGWGPLSQTYSSRVYCLPGRGVVEAVSGRRGVPTLTADEQAELGLSGDAVAEPGLARPRRHAAADDHGDDDTFESLVTRWTVKALDGDQVPAADAAGAGAGTPSQSRSDGRTRVELHIRFQFRNPLYQIAAAQIGHEMASKMIEAFEERAAALLGPPRARSS
ncbi:cyclase-dehydrase family protein [Niveomyces insectorum RCEF 264]|uniref:Cyclase-dehydrase family protein n=1 Tax=Niveomyces insectorum RCEF 264 TaxID=1081102 RepID=A0A167X4E6_9HYPO|nr:cyclase-dehydrase family protein [Niveomyces insectorum RCEF 264]